MGDLSGLNTQTQFLEQAVLGPLHVFKCGGSHDATRRLVRNTQHDASATLVGQRAAVLDQEFEIEAIVRFFELKVLVLLSAHPLSQLRQGFAH